MHICVQEIINKTYFESISGMNISGPPNVRNMNNNNQLKIVTDNATSMKPQPQQAMSSTSPSSGAATPTSDFVDDSGVSEDNASSVTSGSEQGSCIYRNVRTTPASFATSSRERERDSDTIDNEDFDDANNNTINKTHTNSNHNNEVPPTTSIIHMSPGGSTVLGKSA